jgi:DNA-binding XRE family transcriptional regulator
LARAAGISRQTIYAIEAGSYVPNTLLALKLARTLEASVEEMFALPESLPVRGLGTQEATVLAGAGTIQPGEPVQFCRVNRRMFASTPSPVPWFFPASNPTFVFNRLRAAGPR